MKRWAEWSDNWAISTPAPDTSPASWLAERLMPWPDQEGGVRVGAIVPTGFEAYARIFHPAESEGKLVRWADVAAFTGRNAHPLMEWDQIANPARDSGQPAWEHARPRWGVLPEAQIHALAVGLREFTSTPDVCWFCLWTGFGGIAEGGSVVSLPGRDYFLSYGDVNAITSFYSAAHRQPANIWWPDDRAWCVASEIDLMATYVGGSSECIAQLLASDELEVMQTSVDARVDSEADVVNRD
jgi:hypothetical protein